MEDLTIQGEQKGYVIDRVLVGGGRGGQEGEGNWECHVKQSCL